MNIRSLLDEIEQLMTLDGRQSPDRITLLKWMSSELNELTSKIDADFFYVHLDPVVTTQTGTREYNLPENFPENFVRHAGHPLYRTTVWSKDAWTCKLDDGTNESLLNYWAPTQFYSQNLTAESNGKPNIYTIVSNPNGRRQIVLSPPPDSNSSNNYTIDGLYKPTDWTLSDQSTVPPLPANSAVLKYGVLRRLNPNLYEGKYAGAVNDLLMVAANNRVAQFVPNLGRSGRNDYKAVRR